MTTKCPDCGKTAEEDADSGEQYCEHCGWAYPGLPCTHCHRPMVTHSHLAAAAGGGLRTNPCPGPLQEQIEDIGQQEERTELPELEEDDE